MTFDFTQDWFDGAAALPAESCASLMPARVLVSPLAPPGPRAPAHPSVAELALLVGELFAEGSLTFQQLRSLGNLPELQAHLGEALAAVPPARRLLVRTR